MPKGTSEYQAAWILEEEEEGAGADGDKDNDDVSIVQCLYEWLCSL